MDRAVHTRLSVEVAHAIVERHRLPAVGVSLKPWIGGGSCVYPLGDRFVLKVPHRLAAPIESIRQEAIAMCAAHAVGVHTPRLIAFDDACNLLPVPYLVFERVTGEPLKGHDLPTESAGDIWRAVGRDLALLHTRVTSDEALRRLPVSEQSADTDPRPWVDDLQRAGELTSADARWLRDVLNRLAPAALANISLRVCHGDVNAANVMVRRGNPPTYAALLDWGGAIWRDPAGDFSGMSLRAVPFALEGYRELSPLNAEGTAERRILWSYLQLALFSLNRSSLSASARAERIDRLLADTRQFLRRARLA